MKTAEFAKQKNKGNPLERFRRGIFPKEEKIVIKRKSTPEIGKRRVPIPIPTGRRRI